jgi:hypothetical protein
MFREEQVAVDLATERIIHPLYISHFFTFPAMIQPTTPLANATMSHEVNRFIIVPFHAELTSSVRFAYIRTDITVPIMDDQGQSPGS